MTLGHRLFLVASCLLLGCLTSARGQELPGDSAGSETVFYHAETFDVTFTETGEVKRVSLSGNVKILYREFIITAQEAVFDRETGKITAKGQVHLETTVGVFTADDLSYDVGRATGVLWNASLVADPFYGRGDKVEQFAGESMELENGYVTTCDRVPPHYRIRARRIIYVPDQYLRAERVSIVFGKNFHVFTFPRLTQDLRPGGEPTLTLVPGFRTHLGGITSISLSHSLSDTSDLAFSERLSISTRGFGGGMSLASVEEELRIEGFAFKDFGEDEFEYGAVGRYRADRANGFGAGQAILNWRWMSNDEFFNDFFHRGFIANTRNYNNLYLGRRFDAGTLDLLVRENARDPFLDVEKLPELRFHSPLAPLGDSRWRMANTVEAGRFEVGGAECDRVAGSLRVEGSFPGGPGVVRPWLDLSAASYRTDLLDRTNVTGEAGVSLSTLFRRVPGESLGGTFTPTVSLLGRSAARDPGELPVSIDEREAFTDGFFLRLDGAWSLRTADKERGWLSFSGEYDLSRQECGEAVFTYDLDLGSGFSLLGEHVAAPSAGEYVFGASDLTYTDGVRTWAFGTRHMSRALNGVEGWYQQPLSSEWTVLAGASYDFRSRDMVTTSLELWKKLHCWTVEVRVSRDRDDTSVSVTLTPNAFRRGNTWKERFLRWR